MDITKEYQVQRDYGDNKLVLDSCSYCTLSDAQERVTELFLNDKKVISVTIIKQINTYDGVDFETLCISDIGTYYRG